MTINAIDGKGVNRAEAVCDDCGRSEVVTSDYVRRSAGNWSPNEGQVKKKLAAHGWSDVKNKLRCPKCEAKRKVIPMTKPAEEAKAAAPSEPSKAKKREIIMALEEYYDSETERYKANETDETIAQLCEVMPGWVAKLRDDLFGPSGGNENIEDVDTRLAEAERQIKGIIQASAAQHEKAEKKLAEVSAMRAELERIKKAVGPRVLARAGA